MSHFHTLDPAIKDIIGSMPNIQKLPSTRLGKLKQKQQWLYNNVRLLSRKEESADSDVKLRANETLCNLHGQLVRVAKEIEEEKLNG